MVSVETEHRKENGEQVTERVVEFGDETARFEIVDGQHQYRGDGGPPAEAVAVLDDFGAGTDELPGPSTEATTEGGDDGT